MDRNVTRRCLLLWALAAVLSAGAAQAQIAFRAASSATQPVPTFRAATSATAVSPAPAPTFVNAGAVASGTGAITPALPAGIEVDDILLLFLETSNQAIAIANQNGGTWTAVVNSPQSTGTAAAADATRLTVFWSRYNGSQGDPTTSDSGNHQLGRIIAVRGVLASGNPWDVTAGGVEAGNTDTSGSIPGTSATVANTLVVAAIATALPDATTTTVFSAWANGNLAGVTERTDNAVANGNGGGLGIATGTRAATGAYGATTVTTSVATAKAMMSIALRPANVSLTINRPAGTVANDVMVASIGLRTNQPGLSSDIGITPPSGWTLVRRLDNAGPTDSGLAVYQKAAGGSEPASYTWGLTCSATCATSGFQAAVGGIASFSNTDTATPVDVDNGQFTPAAANHSTPNVITTVANAMLVTTHGLPNNNTWQNPAPSGMTQAYQRATPSEAIQVSYALQPAAGATGAKQATDNGPDAVDAGNAHILALRPAPQSSITIGKPAGTVQNDAMIASIGFSPNTLSITGVPAGWTLVRRVDNSNSNPNSLAVYRLAAGAAEPASYTWTFSAAGYLAGSILAFSGVDTTTPVDVENGNCTQQGNCANTTLSHATPSVTTTVADTMLVTSHTYSSAGTWTPPGGMTEAVDVQHGNQSLEVNYLLQAATGATWAKTATASTQADVGNAHILALRLLPVVPTLVSATIVCGTTNQIEVLFSVPVTTATAQNIANYALDGGLAISSAVLGADARLVTLTTTTPVASQLYTLTVNNVVAVGGGAIAPNSQTSFFAEGGYLSGLLGTYYDQNGVQRAYFTGNTATRVDGPLDFAWGAGAPVAGIGADDFSVVWEGFVTPTTGGSYTFRTNSDDGIRLYIDGNLVIDNWTDHGPTNNDSAPIALVADQRYSVRMEFYERGGGAVAQLLWSGPSTGGFQFIPRSNLSHFCGLPRPVAFYKMDEATWNGTAGEVADSSGNGLHATAFGGAVPAFAKVCNGAQLNAVSPAPLDRYLELAHDARFDATNALTVAAWINPSQWPAAGELMTIASKDTNWEFHVNSSGQIFWWWNTGAAALTTTGAAAAPLNTWTHVAIVFALGQQTIYVNGVPRATGTDATVLTNNTLPLQIGGDQNFAGGGRRFRGMVDELRIYDRTLSQAQITQILNDSRPCAVVFNHVRLEHDGIALTCQPETVTVKACADAACASTYAGSVQTTLTPTGWIGGDTITITGGTATVQLRRTSAGVVTLGAGATTPIPVTAARCFDGPTETCSLDFRTSGFIFDAPDLTSCKTSASVTLTAVRADDTSQKCVPAFESGTRTVNFWSTYSSPATGTQQVAVNGTGVGTAAPGTGIDLSFGPGAVASFTVRYPDAGQVQLNARYNPSSGAEAGLDMSGADNFVAVPVGLAVVPSGGACVAGDASCAAYRKAGESFNHNVKAACWTADGDTDLSDNPATPNFQLASIPLAAELVAPAGGTNATLGTTTMSFVAGDNGDKTVSQTVSEVGVFRIKATPAAGAYFGYTVPEGVSANIGRFTPDHFTLLGGATLANRAGASCGPPSTFTYMDEDFSVQFTLRARNVLNQTTVNYTTASGFAKLDPGNIGSLALGARSGATLLTGRIDPGASASGGFAGGDALVTASLGIERGANPDGPYPGLQIGIVPTDSDGITITGLDFDGDATAGNERKNLGVTTEVRFGRLRLENAYGSNLVALPMPIQTQYWNLGAFQRNAEDDCTRLAATDVAISSPTGNLAVSDVSIAEATIAFAGGRGRMTLSPPGANKSGSLLFTPSLGGAGLQYLRGAWTAPTWDQNPAGRAGWGLYGSQPKNFIFRRENY